MPKSNYWPTTREEISRMKKYQIDNLKTSKTNRAENWFAEKLKTSGLKFKRQARWGFRIFDFWNHNLGVAIEIDGSNHQVFIDSLKDKDVWERSGIVVYRVRNFNEEDAELVLGRLKEHSTWSDRRISVGKNPIRGSEQKCHPSKL